MSRSRTRRFLNGTLLFAALFLMACGGPTFIVQQYDGPIREPETIAIVRVDGKELLVLDSLDGEGISVRVPEDSRLHVEILPGKHRLTVRNIADTAAPLGRAVFLAEVGRVYRPVFTTAGSVRVYEVDRGSDALLRDVTILEPVGDYLPPLPPPPLHHTPAPAEIEGEEVPPPPIPTPEEPDAGVVPDP